MLGAGIGMVRRAVNAFKGVPRGCGDTTEMAIDSAGIDEAVARCTTPDTLSAAVGIPAELPSLCDRLPLA